MRFHRTLFSALLLSATFVAGISTLRSQASDAVLETWSFHG
jgi:hypothetical protein